MDLQKLLRNMKKICFLPPLPTLLIAVPSFTLVIWVLVNEPVHPVIANLAYVLSAYALIITITGVAGIVKWVRAGVYEYPLVKKLLGISLVDRYFKETMFRAEISLYPGLLINLTAALVSMLSLETAMLTQFGAARDAAFRQRMSAITGTGVCMVVLGMAVYIIIQTTIQIRKCKQGGMCE